MCVETPDCFVEQRLVLDDAAGLKPAARRQDHFRLGVVDPSCELVGRETTEHHRVHRADARTGEHGDRRLWYHRHIEEDSVALLDAEVAQDRGQDLGFNLKLAIGERALLPGQRRIVNDRQLLAATLPHVAVDGVPTGVADAADEPAPVDAGIRVEHPLCRLDPVDLLRGFAPKPLRVVLPASIDLVIVAPSSIHGALLRG